MKLLVCLIDDDLVYQHVTKIMLNNANSANIDRIIQLHDGQQAIDYFVKNAGDPIQLPDVIFLDINMPHKDGWEFLEDFSKLKVSKAGTIYIVSSSVSAADRERANDHSMVSGYVVKPVAKQDLEKLLLDIINKKPEKDIL